MSWYYDQENGQIQELTGVAKFAMDREIDLEKLQSAVVPERFYGPFATRAEAEDFKAHNPSIIAGIQAIPGTAQQAVGAIVPDVAAAVTSFGNQLVKLSLRLAEVAVGVVLLAIAANVILKQLTGVDVAGAALKGGKKAAKTGAELAVVA